MWIFLTDVYAGLLMYDGLRFVGMLDACKVAMILIAAAVHELEACCGVWHPHVLFVARFENIGKPLMPRGTSSRSRYSNRSDERTD